LVASTIGSVDAEGIAATALASTNVELAAVAAEAQVTVAAGVSVALAAMHKEIAQAAEAKIAMAAAMKKARVAAAAAAKEELVVTAAARATAAKAAEQEHKEMGVTLQHIKAGHQGALAAAVAKCESPTLDAWRAVEAPLALVGLNAGLVLEYAEGKACSFFFLHAEKLRAFEGTSLPKLQDIRRDYPYLLEQRVISFIDGCKGKYKGEVLAVSHCWEAKDEPDKEGAQFAALQQHLVDNPEIKLVWIDYSGMPQGKKSDWEDCEFTVMLPNINLLYLFCSVLVILDRQYMGRFWTQFEAFLSLRTVTADGLVYTPEAERRCTVKCIRNASKHIATALIEEWEMKTVAEAYEVLKQPDVQVTSQRDKDIQLPKLLKLDEFAKRVFADDMTH